MEKNIVFASQLDITQNDSTEFYNLVLFDLDGTLIDSGRGIMKSIAYALTSIGQEVPNNQTLRKFIGPPLLWSYINVCGMDEEMAKEAVKLYREHYPKEDIYDFDVYEGVHDLVKYIHSKGAKIYLATSKPQVFAVNIIKHMGLSEYFDGIIGSNIDNSRSEKAQIVELALELGTQQLTDEFGDTLINPLMIGDRKYDIIGAHENDIACVAVDNGYGSIEEYEEYGADYIFESMKDSRWFNED